MSNHRTASMETYYSSKSQSSFPSENPVPVLQIILDEKNRMIDNLNKQIRNQKIQLEFYIKKEINCPEMSEFAKSCLAERADDNLAVSMAVGKFFKDSGVKSRIMKLYEKSSKIADRVSCIIQTQEAILDDILKTLRKFMTPHDIKKFLGDFDINSLYIENFNTLVDTTLALKKHMATFNCCCERLLTTEEKRNEIVEQVYSLPQEERTICNYLVNLQMEKSALEDIVTQIIKPPKRDSSVADELDIIENNLKVLRENIEQELEEESDYGFVKMLEKIYAQAMSLLALSREQKDKYGKESEHLVKENRKLREIIKEMNEQKIQKGAAADLKDVEKLHEVIQRTIAEARRFEESKSEELKEKVRECEVLKKKLSQTEMQKRHLMNLLEIEKSEGR